jgi:hypothetical protein
MSQVTDADVLRGARELAPEFSARASESEVLRTMPAELAAKAKSAGLFRLASPFPRRNVAGPRDDRQGHRDAEPSGRLCGLDRRDREQHRVFRVARACRCEGDDRGRPRLCLDEHVRSDGSGGARQ